MPFSSLACLLQDELICFYEAAERFLMMGEVLLGWVVKESGETICNPHNKAACVLSRSEVDMFLTVAWGGGEAQPGDWVPADT